MEHPSFEEIVLLHSGELDGRRVPEVEGHLAACASCADKYGRLNETYGLVADSLPRRSWASSAVVKKSVAVTLSAAMAIYLLTDGTPSARADELLSRASAEEMKSTRRRQVMRVQSGQMECHLVSETGIASSISDNEDCNTIATTVRRSGWEAGELLSPQRFQQWRRGVAEKEDSVERLRDESSVTTKAEAGALRMASLRIRLSDYRPISARYEFAGERDADSRVVVEVIELESLPQPLPEVAELRPPGAEEPAPSPAKPRTRPAAAIDPADRREASVRLILHEERADGNVLLAVERAGAELRVWGVTGDDRLKTKLTQRLAAIEGVAVELASEREQQEAERPSPWNPKRGDTAPLAAQHLDALFPNRPEAKQEYLNGLDRLAREIAGLTRDREAVGALRRRLAEAPKADRLADAAATLDRRAVDRIAALRSALSPLLAGAELEVDGTMSAEDGAQLYGLVQRVAILAVQDESLTLEDALNRLALLVHQK